MVILIIIIFVFSNQHLGYQQSAAQAPSAPAPITLAGTNINSINISCSVSRRATHGAPTEAIVVSGSGRPAADTRRFHGSSWHGRPGELNHTMYHQYCCRRYGVLSHTLLGCVNLYPSHASYTSPGCEGIVLFPFMRGMSCSLGTRCRWKSQETQTARKRNHDSVAEADAQHHTGIHILMW